MLCAPGTAPGMPTPMLPAVGPMGHGPLNGPVNVGHTVNVAVGPMGHGPLNVCVLPNGKRALLMFCSPVCAPLDCTLEVRGLQTAGLLRTSPPPMRGGSFEDLRHALYAVQPHLLWFAGHGDARLGEGDGRRTLGFSASDGVLETFDPVAIALEVQPHLPLFGGCLECIVLNACCTGGKDASEGRLGDLLHQMGAPSVVCWGSPADNVACAYFAAGMGAALMQRSTRPPAAHDGAGHASAKGANDDDAASYASADDAPRSIYASAFERGKRNVCAVPMSSAVPGARTQRFMFVDPTDPTKVIQPADVAAGHAEPRALYRVRSGVGAGRVAAGLPILLENASLTDAGARPVRRRVPTAAEGTPGTAPRLLWGIALVGIALGGLALLAALGVGGGPLAPFGARSGAATTLSQPVPLADRPPSPL